jgi:uncharacterized protein with von Willebrand factor type A (vWA) domain
MSQDKFEEMARAALRDGEQDADGYVASVAALLRRVADEEARECEKICNQLASEFDERDVADDELKAVGAARCANRIHRRLATRQHPAEARERT